MAPDSRLDKTSTTPGGFRVFFNRRNFAGLVGAAVVGPGLNLGTAGAVAGYVAFRWVYSKTEQFVPFTKRRHIILMPSVAETLLGGYLYENFLNEQGNKGTLLDTHHSDTSLVLGIAKRLIKVVEEGHGGGYQKHLRNFKWSVSVVKEPINNAFVFPGGYIVVYTGLLKLLHHDQDLIAMVMGHEIAHALARHNTEKMGMGLVISMVLSMLVTTLGGGPDSEAQRKRQEELERERTRRGYHQRHTRLVSDLASDGSSMEQQQGLPAGAMGAGHYPSVPRADAPPIQYNPPGYGKDHKKGSASNDAPPQLPPWMSEDLLRSLSNVLLELPFSRRAETEADLIGIKLMALAGFNPNKGPEAFKLLASVSESSRRSGAESLLSGLGCTHPDSNRRAELLNKELQWMAQNRGEANSSVGSKLEYWSL